MPRSAPTTPWGIRISAGSIGRSGRAGRVASGRIEDDAARRAVLCAGANCNRSSGNWSLTRVPEPTRLTRYPSVCNCSKTLTTTRRDTPCCAAKSRVAGRRMPRLSRPVSIAPRSSSYSQRVSVVSGGRGPSANSGIPVNFGTEKWTHAFAQNGPTKVTIAIVT